MTALNNGSMKFYTTSHLTFSTLFSLIILANIKMHEISQYIVSTVINQAPPRSLVSLGLSFLLTFQVLQLLVLQHFYFVTFHLVLSSGSNFPLHALSPFASY